MKKVEIISQSLLDAINAQKGGANRTELVSALSEGGLTPSYGMVKSVIDNVDIEVAVMVRPTSKSFCYEKQYLDVMKKDAEFFQEIGVKRIVIGILDERGGVDLDALNYVLENINIDVTFHRAIDESKDIIESVKKINTCKKITHILTSGGRKKAMDSLDLIKKMVEISRPKIMIGSGLNLESVDIIKDRFNEMDIDIHFGTYVQNEKGVVDSKKVKEIVEKLK